MWVGASAMSNQQPAVIRNIVLTGFMGTGKTTIGKLVADFVGWHFADADDEIVDRVGMSIPEIFSQYGEQGFRRYEKIVCQSLAARSQWVIATGGGMLIDPDNRALMMASGFVICLTAAPEVIRERLSGFEGRPLAPDWERLLEKRRVIYDQFPYQIDTTARTPQEIAQEIIDLWCSALT